MSQETLGLPPTFTIYTYTTNHSCHRPPDATPGSEVATTARPVATSAHGQHRQTPTRQSCFWILQETLDLPPTFTPNKLTFLYLPLTPTDCTSVASTDNSQRSLNSSISQFGCSQMRPTRVSLLRVFFFFFFFFPSKEQVLL